MKRHAKKQMWTFLLVFGGLAFVMALAAAGFKTQTARAEVEQAAYAVTAKKDGYELREYKPAILAKVLMDGPANEAMNRGFGPLAGYIFGDNTTKAPEGGEENIAMTTPVTMEANTPPPPPPATEPGNEKIEMTTPVTMEANAAAGNWVAFTMPSKYTLETLPTPKNSNVILEARPAYKAAAITFSGGGGMELMHEHEELLRACLKRDGVEVVGNPTYARYDPPWTLPLLRRNEVILPVKVP